MGYWSNKWKDKAKQAKATDVQSSPFFQRHLKLLVPVGWQALYSRAYFS